ncbi:MAG: ribosome biogenesis GTP-binding protein YihA/YsxC [Bacteroidota bacterium]|jgi:GTP-binding protein|nr:ribosome biogenesis GTP-binding protein YihA/YsxC [Bacteroidota bacterium]
MQLRAVFEIGAASPQQFPEPAYPEIAFAGRSNVGKSSLLNMLVGARQLAKVSATPGKTQQINFFLVEDRLRFVDLPGYGYAKASQGKRRDWGRLITAYFDGGRPLAMVLQLVDARLPLQDSDARVLRWFVENGFPLQVALTKIDKLKQGERVRQERSLSLAMEQLGYRGGLLLLSSLKGTGKKELLASMFTRIDTVE